MFIFTLGGHLGYQISAIETLLLLFISIESRVKYFNMFALRFLSGDRESSRKVILMGVKRDEPDEKCLELPREDEASRDQAIPRPPLIFSELFARAIHSVSYRRLTGTPHYDALRHRRSNYAPRNKNLQREMED